MSLNYDQTFVLNGQQLSGVSSLVFDYNFGVGKIETLGAKNFGFTKVSPPEGSVSFNRSLIYNDPLLNYTGDSACSGHFQQNGVTNLFTSGYLTRYSVSCGVGQIPAVSSEIRVFGEMKSGVGGQIAAHPDVFIPSPKSIEVSNVYGNSNKVKDFSYSLEIPREPKYSVGANLYPDAVVRNGAIQISASISFDVRGFSPLDVHSFAKEVSAPSFSVNIKDRTLSTTLMSLSVHNAQIISQTLDSNTDSPLTLNLSYEGYVE